MQGLERHQENLLAQLLSGGCRIMAEEQIKITIDENGTFHAETHGLKGSDCLDALDELLGVHLKENLH